MIDYATGDLLGADREALVNSVNCVGVMGRGAALAFKRRFPANSPAYRAACDWGEVEPGRMFVFETDELMPRYTINFPTKRHWRARSRLGDIEAGLCALVAEIKQRRFRSIALSAWWRGSNHRPASSCSPPCERQITLASDPLRERDGWSPPASHVHDLACVAPKKT